MELVLSELNEQIIYGYLLVMFQQQSTGPSYSKGLQYSLLTLLSGDLSSMVVGLGSDHD